jgi:hypothetical protein
MCVVEIGAVAHLNEDESDFRSGGGSDYVVVGFTLFAELSDGRRIETGTVFQYGGRRDGWLHVFEGELIDRRLSAASVATTAEVVLAPSGSGRRFWTGIVTRLEHAGLSVPQDELFGKPFRAEMEARVQEICAL